MSGSREILKATGDLSVSFFGGFVVWIQVRGYMHDFLRRVLEAREK